MNGMEYVTKEFCNERHGNTKDERATLKGRVTEHGKEIEALQKVADHQTSSIESITVRLESRASAGNRWSASWWIGRRCWYWA